MNNTQITPAEYEIVLAYRKLANRDVMTVTRLDGKVDCKITTSNTIFVASDKDIAYNIHTNKSHE